MNNFCPLVSVVIPTYNRFDLLRECLDSCLTQSYPNLEIIVCDNDSSDETDILINEYKKYDRRISYIKQEKNIGPVRNWITGVNCANGKYVKILFSDDTLHKDYLTIAVNELERNENIDIFTCAVRIGLSLDQSKVLYDLGKNKILSKNALISATTKGRLPYSPCAILAKTEIYRTAIEAGLKTNEFADYDQHGAGPDVLSIFRSVRNSKSIAYVNQALVFFRSHDQSISIIDQDSELIRKYISAIAKYLYLENRLMWYRYVAKQALKKVIREKRICHLVSIFKIHRYDKYLL